MNIEEYREYCLSIKGVTESFPFDEHTLAYKIMDKMFTFAPLNPKADLSDWYPVLAPVRLIPNCPVADLYKQ